MNNTEVILSQFRKQTIFQGFCLAEQNFYSGFIHVLEIFKIGPSKASLLEIWEFLKRNFGFGNMRLRKNNINWQTDRPTYSQVDRQTQTNIQKFLKRL